jgi:hypothetical protein
MHLGLHTEGGTKYLYAADTGHYRLVKMTTTGSMATTVVDNNSEVTGPQFNSLCYYGNCSFDWNAAGELFISDQFYDPAAGYYYGIARWDPVARAVVPVAGTYSATPVTGDGVAATRATFSSAPRFTLDPSGGLYLSDGAGHRVRRVDGSGTISTLAGNGTAGATGDFGPSTSARVNTPGQLVKSNGHIYFIDETNHALRIIW